MFELVQGRTQQYLDGPFFQVVLVQQFGIGEKHRIRLDVIDNLRSLGAFHQHLDGAVRQLQQLQDVGHRSHFINLVDIRVIFTGALLGDQQYLLVAVHGGIQRLDGFLPAHEQRNDHIRVNHYVA